VLHLRMFGRALQVGLDGSACIDAAVGKRKVPSVWRVLLPHRQNDGMMLLFVLDVIVDRQIGDSEAAR